MRPIPHSLAVLLAVAAFSCGGELVTHTPYDSSAATKRLPVALISMRSNLEPEANRARMHDQVVRAAADHPGVRLIAFGETSLGWYFKAFDPDYQRRIAEPLDGATVSLMKTLAVEHHTAIAFGFSEADGGKVYNAAVIIDDRGEIIAHHRKSNFVVLDEWSGFTRGETTLTTATLDGIKVALLVCNDFNEKSYQTQINADSDIKVVLLPHASAGLQADSVRNHAYEYEGAWMLAAQRMTTERTDVYHGSWVLDPNGYMVANAESAEEPLFYEVRTE